jgi:hypothetical protein
MVNKLADCSLQFRRSTAKLLFEDARRSIADPICQSENDIRPACPRFKPDSRARFVCSFLQYFAVPQHFSSIRTRLNNRRSNSVGSTQRKQSLGRRQPQINDHVGVGTIGPTRNSQMREREGRVMHWSALTGCARIGDRATSGSPGAVSAAQSHSSRLEPRRWSTTQKRVVCSRQREFLARNTDCTQFAVPAGRDETAAFLAQRIAFEPPQAPKPQKALHRLSVPARKYDPASHSLPRSSKRLRLDKPVPADCNQV